MSKKTITTTHGGYAIPAANKPWWWFDRRDKTPEQRADLVLEAIRKAKSFKGKK